MRFFKKAAIAMMFGFGIQTSVLADDVQISRYEQAKLRLSYEGSVGNLLQELSQRLKVGFIAYDVDTGRNVLIQNEVETPIKSIYEQIEKQLSDIHIRFEKIENRIFMIVSAKGGEPLLKEAPKKQEQFIGNIIFEDDDITKTVAANLPNTQSGATPSRLQEIFNIATNKELLEAAKNKKTPKYKISTQERLELESVRVTTLATFLIFDKKIDTTKLKVKGEFEDMAQGENVVAILHQNKEAPSRIEVENAEGKKLLLEAHQEPKAKTTRKRKTKK